MSTERNSSTVRRATTADHEAIVATVVAAYGPYAARIGKAPAPMNDDYRARISAAEAFVLEDSGAVVGIIVIVAAGDHLQLDNVAVMPTLHGRGLGRVLFEFAEDEARRRGLAEIRLYTNEAMTENISLYQRVGYRETHRAIDDGYERVFFSLKLPRERK